MFIQPRCMQGAMAPVKHKVFNEEKQNDLREQGLQGRDGLHGIVGTHVIEDGMAEHDHGEDEQEVRKDETLYAV